MTEEKQSPPTKAAKKSDELILFCPCCFASSDGGSWTVGEAVVESLCSNCGAGGPSLRIPRWAVESIRKQASWVGKRYYPHDEDKETYEEVRALRAAITEFPGRSVSKHEDSWCVTQRLASGSNASIFVDFKKAKSWDAALEYAKLILPYVPNPSKT